MTSVPLARRRASAASRSGSEESGRTATDSGSESLEPVPATDAVFEAAELEDDPGLEDEQVEELVGARPPSPAPPPDGLPWSEIERNASDIWFVHSEAAADRRARLRDEEEREHDVDQRERRARRPSRSSGAAPAPSTSPRCRRPRPRGRARARRRRWRRSSGSPRETGAERPRPAGRLRAVDEIEAEGEAEEGDQQVRQEARQRARGSRPGSRRSSAARRRRRRRRSARPRPRRSAGRASSWRAGSGRRGRSTPSCEARADVAPDVARRAGKRVREQHDRGAEPERPAAAAASGAAAGLTPPPPSACCRAPPAARAKTRSICSSPTRPSRSRIRQRPWRYSVSRERAAPSSGSRPSSSSPARASASVSWPKRK